MKKSNVLKVLIAVILVLALLPSCGTKTIGDIETKQDSALHGEKESAKKKEEPGVIGLTAKKLFEFDGYDVSRMYKNLLIYKNDTGDKYGLRLYNGTDTGPKFDYIDENEGLITVSDSFYSKYKASDDVASVNVFGLYDSYGNKITGCDYACFKKLNDRYAEAYRATSPVSEGMSDSLRKGEKYAGTNVTGPHFSYEKSFIDLKTGKTIDESQMNYFNTSGKKSFKDASYVIRTTELDTVYDIDDSVLFTYDPEEYRVSFMDDDYYVAEKTVNGETSYYLLDKTGKTVYNDISRNFDVYGNVISMLKDGQYYLYDFDGKQILDKSVDYVLSESLTKDLLIAKTADEFIFLNGEGKKLLTVPNNDEDDIDLNSSYGLVYKKDKESGDSYYNYSEKKYSIKGYRTSPAGHMLVTVTDGDSRYDLIDATNGNMLCQGYKSYYCSNPIDGCCIVTARRIEGGSDIYLIQNKIDAVKNSFENDETLSSNKLGVIYEMKEDLFGSLEKALKNAGLTASIDRDSGEIAFDAAVIFAGDSAELSDAGKKLLDSFMKAYNSVLSDEKFKGFIEKTVVEGHTAPLANSTYESGLPLSKERAGNVMDYCKSAGGSADSFEAVGYSNSMPIYNLDGTVNLDASRRVTFKCIINADY